MRGACAKAAAAAEGVKGTLPASELVWAVAPRVWAAARELGFAWAEVSGGFPASVSVRKRPRGIGIPFGSGKEGLEVVLDRAQVGRWMKLDGNIVTGRSDWLRIAGGVVAPESLEETNYLEKERWLWRVKRNGTWSIRRTAECFGKRHEIFFTDRGVRSPHHRPEEIAFLEQLGEGCGLLLHRWRKAGDGFGYVNKLFAFRRGKGSTKYVSKAEKWRSLIAGMIQEQLMLSGIPGFIMASNEITLYVMRHKDERDEYDLGEPGPKNTWFRNVWKLGLRAVPGRFPLKVEGERAVWLVRTRRGVSEHVEPLLEE